MAGGGGHGPDIDLVPILDAMTAVIFFLVLSGTFIEFTKLTIPQAKTSTITNPIAPAPVAPRLFAVVDNEMLKLVLKWDGVKPGMTSKTVQRERQRSTELEKIIAEMTAEFKNTYPSEKSIQIGLSKTANFQETVSIIDGVKKNIPDVVMNSYNEEQMFKTSNSSDGHSAKDAK